MPSAHRPEQGPLLGTHAGGWPTVSQPQVPCCLAHMTGSEDRDKAREKVKTAVRCSDLEGERSKRTVAAPGSGSWQGSGLAITKLGQPRPRAPGDTEPAFPA